MGAGLVFDNISAKITESYATGTVLANGCVSPSNCGSAAGLVYDNNNGLIAQSFERLCQPFELRERRRACL